MGHFQHYVAKGCSHITAEGALLYRAGIHKSSCIFTTIRCVYVCMFVLLLRGK